MITNITALNELLNRACALIDSLEGSIIDINKEYRNSDLQKDVDAFFNEVDHLNEDTGPEYDSAGFTEEDRIVDGQYRNYVDTVKRNIDQAVADGILKSGTECMSYSYMSKKGFAMRMETDPEFAKQWENWLFPGEPLHDYDPDAEAQDFDTFGNHKI